MLQSFLPLNSANIKCLSLPTDSTEAQAPWQLKFSTSCGKLHLNQSKGFDLDESLQKTQKTSSYFEVRSLKEKEMLILFSVASQLDN